MQSRGRNRRHLFASADQQGGLASCNKTHAARHLGFVVCGFVVCGGAWRMPELQTLDGLTARAEERCRVPQLAVDAETAEKRAKSTHVPTSHVRAASALLYCLLSCLLFAIRPATAAPLAAAAATAMRRLDQSGVTNSKRPTQGGKRASLAPLFCRAHPPRQHSSHPYALRTPAAYSHNEIIHPVYTTSDQNCKGFYAINYIIKVHTACINNLLYAYKNNVLGLPRWFIIIINNYQPVHKRIPTRQREGTIAPIRSRSSFFVGVTPSSSAMPPPAPP